MIIYMCITRAHTYTRIQHVHTHTHTHTHIYIYIYIYKVMPEVYTITIAEMYKILLTLSLISRKET